MAYGLSEAPGAGQGTGLAADRNVCHGRQGGIVLGGLGAP